MLCIVGVSLFEATHPTAYGAARENALGRLEQLACKKVRGGIASYFLVRAAVGLARTAMNDPILYAIAVIALLATPGPTNTLLATSGAIAGVRASVRLLAGELAGYLIAVFTIRLLLAPVLAAWPKLSVVLTCAVAAYIAAVAIRLWVNGAKLVATGQPVSIKNVFITTLLNPKALVFGLTIIPQAHPHIVEFIVAFCAMIVAIGFSWIVIGHFIGVTVSERHSRIVPRIAAVALVGFAGLLIASALNFHH